MNYFKKSFMESLLELAKIAGVEIPNLSSEFKVSAEERLEIEKVLTETAEFYHKNLTPAVKKYLIESRGFNDELINKFKLGYASGGLKERLIDELGFNADLCLKAGILKMKKNNACDYFYNRITFPSMRSGKVLHISARSFDGREPKYLNPKGPIDYLYNEDALRNTWIILVEGVTDAITLTKFGYPAIAITTSNFQSKFVSKFDNIEIIYVCLDSDKAGILGVMKIGELMPEKIRVIELPEGQDPSDYFKNHTKEDFDRLIEGARDFIDYLLASVTFSQDNKEFEKSLKPVLKVIFKFEGQKKQAYINKVKEEFNLSDDEIDEIEGKVEKTIIDVPDFNVRFDVGYYASQIIKRFHMRYDEYDRLWKYDEASGLWINGAEVDIERVLRTEILPKKNLTNHHVKETIDHIKSLVFKRGVAIEPEPNLIAFNDKIYNLENDTLIDFSPEHFFVNKFPVNINNISNNCPTIEKLFADFVGEDKKEILFELAAYCMYRGYDFQKIFIIIGDGGNGKSTYISILVKLIGKNNVSSVGLREIVNNKFAISLLYKKHINFCGEVDDYKLKNTSILKQLTGGDIIKAENKFEHPYFFVNYAKLIIATNKMPIILDKSEGLYRRIQYIRFPNRFVFGVTADPKVLSKITEEELEGFAHKCIEKLKVLKENGFVFSNVENINGAGADFKEDPLNNLRLFLKIFTEDDPRGTISTTELYTKFAEFLKIDFSEINRTDISKFMEILGYRKDTKGYQDDDEKWTSMRVFEGLNWKY